MNDPARRSPDGFEASLPMQASGGSGRYRTR